MSKQERRENTKKVGLIDRLSVKWVLFLGIGVPILLLILVSVGKVLLQGIVQSFAMIIPKLVPNIVVLFAYVWVFILGLVLGAIYMKRK